MMQPTELPATTAPARVRLEEQPKSPRSMVVYVLIWLSIAAALAATLAQMGRVWWCGCGLPVPWSWDMYSRHASQHFIDPYFFSHLQHGLLLYWLLIALAKGVEPRWRWTAAMIIEAGWEVLENSALVIERYRAATISLDYFGDSVANSLTDLLACAVGYALAHRIGWRWSLAMFFAIELSMVVLLRDSLTLNILMLLYPIDAVKAWQAGG